MASNAEKVPIWWRHHMYHYLSVSNSISISISTCISISISTYINIYISIYTSLIPTLIPTITTSISMSISTNIYISISISLCTYIYMYILEIQLTWRPFRTKIFGANFHMNIIFEIHYFRYMAVYFYDDHFVTGKVGCLYWSGSQILMCTRQMFVHNDGYRSAIDARLQFTNWWLNIRLYLPDF